MKGLNFLFKNQSGLQPFDSTINQLNEMFSIVISNLDKGKYIMFIICDMIPKAFDKVWYKGLIYLVGIFCSFGTLGNCRLFSIGYETHVNNIYIRS